MNLSGRHLLPNEQGHMQMSGELDLNAPWQFRGQLTGQQFRVFNLPELSLEVSPALQVKATQESAQITGQIDIPYGHVVIKTLPPEAVNNANDLVVIRDEPEALNEALVYPVMLDVQARIEDVVKLDVIGLQADLLGNLQIKQGASQQLQGFGELSLAAGTYQVYGQKLTIETGEMYFSGALDNPRLNIKASRQATVDSVKAGVQLGGTVDNLQSELFSEPAMSDVEKLSYIMTGQGINAGGQLDSEALKQTAILLGLSQSSPIFNQIQQQFGIDVLTVKRNGPQAESVIEAGKQINERLYVAYNQGLFNRLGYWVLKYRINQYLNLQSTQGEDQSIELVYTRKAAPKKPKKKPAKD
nr:translocation/assembly module TamB domain-containing protein [Marinicella sp. NBU2979]